MQHPESDVRTWQTKVVRREIADGWGRAGIRAAIGFTHQRRRKTVEPTRAAVDDWVATIVAGEDWWRAGQTGCTPGYLNNEGDLDDYDWNILIYSGGAAAFFDLIAEWPDDGKFEGLAFESDSD